MGMSRSVFGLLFSLAALALFSCRGGDRQVVLNGAGATFPYPLYLKWIAEYTRTNPNVRINYQSIGSGGGIRQITARTVDFGASDAPMTDEQMGAAPGQILHIPTTIGAVVISYNLGIDGELRLSPDLIADIFLGTVKRWDDARLKALNPRLPSSEIIVVHRSDGSGTTDVFTKYLSAVSEAWRQRVGSGTSVNWPVGLGAKGNEGVTGQIKQTRGSIGYIELAYAVTNQLPYAAVRNSSGNFIVPSVESASRAAAGRSYPEDLRVSLVNSSDPRAYPIASFSYILAYREQQDRAKGEALARFLWWAVHEGQQYAPPLHYAPLPAEIIPMIEARIKLMSFQGRPLISQAVSRRPLTSSWQLATAASSRLTTNNLR